MFSRDVFQDFFRECFRAVSGEFRGSLKSKVVSDLELFFNSTDLLVPGAFRVRVFVLHHNIYICLFQDVLIKVIDKDIKIVSY